MPGTSSVSRTVRAPSSRARVTAASASSTDTHEVHAGSPGEAASLP